MSNIFASEHLDSDFVNFQIALSNSINHSNTITSQNKPVIKKYHRLTYLVALFESKLEHKWKSENKYLFLNELLSDLLSNCSLSFIGFYYPSLIITRRLIENFYNHIFYFDHPVEFELLNLGRNDYTPMLDLKLYYEAYPLIKALNDKNIKIFNDQLFQHYQELCKTVHTKGGSFMGLAKNIEEIKPPFDLANHLDHINTSIQNMIYLLFKFHRDLDFTHVETTLIAKTFPKNIRNIVLS